MGRKTFNVPEGFIRERVSWFAVIFQFGTDEVLVVKPTPGEGFNSGSPAMIRRGASLVPPPIEELIVNNDSDDVTHLLSRLLGIPENRIELSANSSRDAYGTNIKHTLYYLFQKQNLICNNEQLLYRQNEDRQQQTIKETFPVLMGVYSPQKFELKAKLREMVRELKIQQKRIEQAKFEIDNSQNRALALVSEAKAAGMIPSSLITSSDTINETLRDTLSWTPAAIPEDDSNRITQIEIELNQLRKMRSDVQRKIEATERYTKEAQGFSREVEEQMDRLQAINALPTNARGEWQWPFANVNLGLDTPIAERLLMEIQSLEQEMRAVVGERPKFDSYLKDLKEEVRVLQETIRQRELELSAAIATNEAIAETRVRDTAAAKVVGRISFFLETLGSSNELQSLEAEYKKLKFRAEQLQQRIGSESDGDRLTSTLSAISAHITRYVNDFDAELKHYPARFDLQNVTVVFDKDERPIPLKNTGSAKNHLAYHLSTVLGIHLFAARNKCPIPRFLVLDQPTQVYFPSEKVYKEIDGSEDKTEKDGDMEMVRQLFRLLLRFTETDCPGFQLIVTEHANLRDEGFKKSLIEVPWRRPPALIPLDWPTLESTRS
jgi:hypothetical protein